jgi:hypothetical protein
VSTTTRLSSGAHCIPPSFAIHTRAFSATNVPPFTV